MRLNSFTRVLTSAEVLALYASPVELLPAKPGVVYVPIFVSFHKGAGTGYTAADLVLESTDGVEFALAPGAGFMDQTTEAVLAQKVLGGSIDAMGLALQVRLDTATATGDQPIRIKLVYFEVYPGLGE